MRPALVNGIEMSLSQLAHASVRCDKAWARLKALHCISATDSRASAGRETPDQVYMDPNQPPRSKHMSTGYPSYGSDGYSNHISNGYSTLNAHGNPQ